MANSTLATYTKLTSNHSGTRTQKICKLTIHYMAAKWTAKQCADYFASTTRNASSNYCIGYDGSIAVSVNESCRAWTSSSEWNDQRAVTIECGNEPDSSLSDACYNALIKLCADICKRNGFTPHYDGTIYGSLTMHKMFASTACPGNWLSAKITSGQLEADILAAMGQSTSSSTTTTTAKYRVRKSANDADTQLGAYASLDNAKAAANANNGYKVYDMSGNLVYTPSTSGEIYWNYNAALAVGDYVSSCPCKIAEYNNTGSCIYDNCVNIPYLGGLIPLADVTEAKGTGDGACDGVLSNDQALVYLDCSRIHQRLIIGQALVYLDCSRITAVDTTNNLVKVQGANSGAYYWLKPAGLCRREYI